MTANGWPFLSGARLGVRLTYEQTILRSMLVDQLDCVGPNVVFRSLESVFFIYNYSTAYRVWNGLGQGSMCQGRLKQSSKCSETLWIYIAMTL